MSGQQMHTFNILAAQAGVGTHPPYEDEPSSCDPVVEVVPYELGPLVSYRSRTKGVLAGVVALATASTLGTGSVAGLGYSVIAQMEHNDTGGHSRWGLVDDELELELVNDDAGEAYAPSVSVRDIDSANAFTRSSSEPRSLQDLAARYRASTRPRRGAGRDLLVEPPDRPLR